METTGRKFSLLWHLKGAFLSLKLKKKFYLFKLVISCHLFHISWEERIWAKSERKILHSPSTRMVKSFEFDSKVKQRTNVQTYKRTNVQTFKRTNVQTYKRTNVQTYRRTNVQTYKRTNVQTYKRTNVQTYKRTNVQTKWQITKRNQN